MVRYAVTTSIIGERAVRGWLVPVRLGRREAKARLHEVDGIVGIIAVERPGVLVDVDGGAQGAGCGRGCLGLAAPDRERMRAGLGLGGEHGAPLGAVDGIVDGPAAAQVLGSQQHLDLLHDSGRRRADRAGDGRVVGNDALRAQTAGHLRQPRGAGGAQGDQRQGEAEANVQRPDAARRRCARIEQVGAQFLVGLGEVGPPGADGATQRRRAKRADYGLVGTGRERVDVGAALTRGDVTGDGRRLDVELAVFAAHVQQIGGRESDARDQAARHQSVHREEAGVADIGPRGPA